MSIVLRELQTLDIEVIAAAFQKIGWNKQPSLYERYFAEQSTGLRAVRVAFADQHFAGYLTVNWQSAYPPFRAQGIPEIQDFNVLPMYRRQGIGTRLMDEAERLISERSSIAGIGVGLYADYGAAQRLYVRRGYVPDGKGLFYENRSVVPGEMVRADDDLVLYLTKLLAPTRSASATNRL